MMPEQLSPELKRVGVALAETYSSIAEFLRSQTAGDGYLSSAALLALVIAMGQGKIANVEIHLPPQSERAA
jgi:hypothetical protein